ncbi:MAG: helix-turn-helix transcriptional regulator [Kiritimatiellales bacterium]
MRKSTHTAEYECVTKKLVQMRTAAGLTQQQMADMLQREQSFVWRIEHGERRVDILEFYWICNALGFDAKSVYNELADSFEKTESMPLAAQK